MRVLERTLDKEVRVKATTRVSTPQPESTGFCLETNLITAETMVI